jgi:hypothetical protein
MSSTTVPPILAALVGRIALAVPARARTTFLELLLGAAATKSGHVTDAILTSGASRSWTTYFWFLERGRWSWLQVWDALLGLLPSVFTPAVWHVVLDDSLVERVSTRAPGSMVHHNHTAKPNRPRFLRGQGWLCLAAVLERDFKVGAVPLMLRLVRRGANRGKLKSARFLLRLLGRRLGQVRVLLDAWFMRGWLIQCALADGHTVIGRVRRDLALYTVPRPLRRRRRGRPRKYGERLTPPRPGSTRCRATAAPASSTASWKWCAGAAAGSPRASYTAGWCGPSGWSWSARIAATGRPSSACCSAPTRTCPPPRSSPPMPRGGRWSRCSGT